MTVESQIKEMKLYISDNTNGIKKARIVMAEVCGWRDACVEVQKLLDEELSILDTDLGVDSSAFLEVSLENFNCLKRLQKRIKKWQLLLGEK